MVRTAPRFLRLHERGILLAISVLGVMFLSYLAYFAWFSLRQKLVDGIYNVTLGVSGDLLEKLPVPTTGTATVTGLFGGNEAFISTVQLNVTDLSAQATAMLVWGHVLSFALHAVIVSAVIYLCIRLLRGRPFARSMTIAAVVVSLALILLGSASDIVGEVLRNTVQTEMLGEGMPPEPYSGGRSFSFPGGYLAAGLAVAVVALAFRIGERVTRDTDGLV